MMNCSGNKGFTLIYGKYRKAFPVGNYESVPISAFPSGESAYPSGFVLPPPGTAVIGMERESTHVCFPA